MNRKVLLFMWQNINEKTEQTHPSLARERGMKRDLDHVIVLKSNVDGVFRDKHREA